MPLANAPIAKFNRGKVDSRVIPRVDIERIAISSEIQTNIVPRSLGSMTLRPGMEFIASSKDDAKAKHIPFIFKLDDKPYIELTDSFMRVFVNDKVVTRDGVSSAITNGTFDTNLDDWTDNDEAGATSAFKAGGFMSLIGTRFNAAIRRQQVTVSAPSFQKPSRGMVTFNGPKMKFDRGTVGETSKGQAQPAGILAANGDQGIPHALRIVIEQGPVIFKIGKTSGGEEYLTPTNLGTGTHSLLFTPIGNFHLEFASRAEAEVLVDSIEIEAAGVMEIPTPWDIDDLGNLRWDRSGEVVYVGVDGKQQRKIERRGTRSWSIVKYEPSDGPFNTQNTSTTTITSDGLSGDVTLTGSRSIWTADHVGALFRMQSVGQNVSAAITGEGQFSDAIRVVGVDAARIFTHTITGTWTATVTLQRSIDDESSWTDVATYTSNHGATAFDDSLDNLIAFYRIGVDTGDFTDGTANVALAYGGGALTGVARITAFTSATSVSAAVLEGHRLGSTTATEDWWEGIWSTRRGFPSAVTLLEGRLWWSGKDWIIGSVSDAFESFDDEVIGDSAPIIRTIGAGSTDIINWLLPLQRLIIGSQSAEISARSSFLDEPLTVTEFLMKNASTEGSAAVGAAVVDTRGLFVDKSTFRLFEMTYAAQDSDYQSTDLAILVPEIGAPGFTHIAVQRKPDTRIHGLRSDGTVGLLVYLPAEDVKAWIDIETGDADGVNGVVEDAFVLPGIGEDEVYYSIARIINGQRKRYLEKWAMESEAIGATVSKQLDSFKRYDGEKKIVLNGLEHLEGQFLVIWQDGFCPVDSNGDIKLFQVIDGRITPDTPAGDAIVGIPYDGLFKSGLLPYAAGLGTTLGQHQEITQIALLLENTHHKGLQFGRDFDNLDPLPEVVNGAVVADNTIFGDLTIHGITFPGENDEDTRFFLKMQAPRPCTIKAAVLGIHTRDKAP